MQLKLVKITYAMIQFLREKEVKRKTQGDKMRLILNLSCRQNLKEPDQAFHRDYFYVSSILKYGKVISYGTRLLSIS